MAVRILAVGRRPRDPLIQVAEDYAQRAARHARIDIVHVEPARRRRGGDDARVRADEAEAVLRERRTARLVLLDATGRSYGSEAFARQLQRWLVAGDLCFAIGGATGWHPPLLQAGHALLSLGPMTLPHRLALLVLCEQLYRAQAILHGEPYHK
ncbi:MAG: 23S rRNA (pseudouridine(1915)-N(3))-methyltransferase RlmH [Pseudomonadota bacterium]